MTAIIAGIDTGLTGAVGFLDRDGGFIAVHDLPVIRDGKLGWIDATALLSILIEVRAGRSMRVIVERTHAMPLNGSQAAFSQGCTLGSVLATLQAAALSVTLVTPATWKKAAGLGSEKAAALDRARMLWPLASLDRKKDHGRAESLLIAEHGRRTLIGGSAAA
jgi:hypothetical protein